jgi:hypothetical protein
MASLNRMTGSFSESPCSMSVAEQMSFLHEVLRRADLTDAACRIDARFNIIDPPSIPAQSVGIVRELATMHGPLERDADPMSTAEQLRIAHMAATRLGLHDIAGHVFSLAFEEAEEDLLAFFREELSEDTHPPLNC